MNKPTVLSIGNQKDVKKGMLQVLPQRGRPSIEPIDRRRPARPPGKRISKNGNVYWETRPNRSDVNEKLML